MQTMRYVVVVLSMVITVSAFSQQPVYVATVNKTKLDELVSSFQASLMTENNRNTFVSMIQNPDQRKLQVKIQHRYTGIVLDTIITAAEYRQRYNMDSADDGDYTITVSCGKERLVKKLALETVTTKKLVLQ